MEQGAGRRALGAGRWAARRVRAGRAGRGLQASVSGRAGAGGRAGAQGRVECRRAWHGRARTDEQGVTGEARTRGGALQALTRGVGERAAGRGRQARGVRGPRRGRAGRTAWACLGAPGALAGPVWGSCNQFGFLTR